MSLTGTWRELIGDATRQLGEPMAARWLVEEASGRAPAELLAHLDEPATEEASAALATLLARRVRGEPLQHVLGHWPFAGVELKVDRRALVPRPETELVVEIALAVLEAAAKERHGRPLLALDLGTGSGAIACALVSRCEVVEVVALDRSIEALALAKENRRSLPEAAGERIRLVESSWYAGLGDELAGSVDLLVSNPPYLAESEWAGLDPVVRDHDPYGALVAGPTGLEAIEEVVSGAPSVLVPHGSVVLELAPAQAADAESLALAAGAASADVLSDLAGRPRVLRARW